MELNEAQRDVLVELINVGFGRAGAALSKLTGYRVLLEPPRVSIRPIAELPGALDGMATDEVATVHQIFSGPVGGDAMLVLDRAAASTLKQLLTDEEPLPLAADRTAAEVLSEVGNILLNACLGTLGNALNVRVSFSVPRLKLATLHALLDSLIISREGLRYALVVHAAFNLRDSQVKGYIVIVLTVDSLERLFTAIDESERRPADLSGSLS